MPQFACKFMINKYGTSGTELMPPYVGGYSFTTLSNEGETDEAFAARMQAEGMKIRSILNARRAKPYSLPDSCSWSLSQVVPLSFLLSKVQTDDQV